MENSHDRRDTTLAALQQRLATLQQQAAKANGPLDPLLEETIELLHSSLAEQLRQQEAALARPEQPELRYRQLEQALHASEERYRRLVEISFDAVLLHADGKIVQMNRSGAHLYGAASPEELIGRSIYDFIHPDDLDPATRPQSPIG